MGNRNWYKWQLVIQNSSFFSNSFIQFPFSRKTASDCKTLSLPLFFTKILRITQANYHSDLLLKQCTRRSLSRLLHKTSVVLDFSTAFFLFIIFFNYNHKSSNLIGSLRVRRNSRIFEFMVVLLCCNSISCLMREQQRSQTKPPVNVDG